MAVTEDPEESPPIARSQDDVLALVICGWQSEPGRVGEVILPGKGGIFGREDPDDGPKLRPRRLRPSGVSVGEPVRCTRISARQLWMEPGTGGLRVENLGRRKLRVGGREVKEAVLRVGAVAELVGELLLMVVKRPESWLQRDQEHADYGLPDADGIVGESVQTWALRQAIAKHRLRGGHVLISGPSGSGKELVARALHREGIRSKGEFVARNAATFPESLVDAELFGHATGYPTAGMPARPGLVGAAHGGTLFLDEIGELPPAAQAHLLRLMDEGEYHRLGEARARQADLRIVGATLRAEEVLRPDLAARFPLRLRLSGLPERPEDIPLLAAHLLRRAARQDPDLARRFFPDAHLDHPPRISLALLQELVAHPYQTHSRELLAFLLKAAENSKGDQLEALGLGSPAVDLECWRGIPPESIPPEVLQAVLDEADGVQELAWQRLGLSSRHQLARLIQRHGLILRRTGKKR